MATEGVDSEHHEARLATDIRIWAESANGSSNTATASAKSTPCLLKLARALAGSHSNVMLHYMHKCAQAQGVGGFAAYVQGEGRAAPRPNFEKSRTGASTRPPG